MTLLLGVNIAVTGEQALTPEEERRDHVGEAKHTEEKEMRETDHDDSEASSVVHSSNSNDAPRHVSNAPVLTVEATAYTAFCNTGCIGVTATGVDVSETVYHEGRRVIAVDPDVIPLGSHVTLTFEDGSTMKAIAEDTGGAIDGNRIDILYADTGPALDFGRQNVKVSIERGR